MDIFGLGQKAWKDMVGVAYLDEKKQFSSESCLSSSIVLKEWGDNRSVWPSQ